ncbi:hypothetical protein WDU94_002157 [Cyamophila willieti]
MNGQWMEHFPVRLLIILCGAVPKDVALAANENSYYEVSVSGDVEKAKELWLELDDQNSNRMTISIHEQNLMFAFPAYDNLFTSVIITSQGKMRLGSDDKDFLKIYGLPREMRKDLQYYKYNTFIYNNESQFTVAWNYIGTIKVDTTTSEYDIPRDDKWEISRQSVTLGHTLGEGAFGKVVRAEARSILKPDSVTTVAVKMLREDHLDAEMIALVSEVEVMKIIGKHVNIINLLGVCSQDGPLYVIVEFAQHNNLRDFLIKHRSPPEYSNVLVSADSSRVVLTEEDLASFAHQVANGMQYLHSKKCLHRDLAARNVLVSENYIMKIADFGLARDVRGKDYYRIASNGFLPMKWMAPESLSHHVFKYESDVWSYGVHLWEVMTFGEAPYPSIQDWDSMINFLRSGHRLKKPSRCSDEIYGIMQDCWKYEATDRPQFSEIVAKLDNRLKTC